MRGPALYDARLLIAGRVPTYCTAFHAEWGIGQAGPQVETPVGPCVSLPRHRSCQSAQLADWARLSAPIGPPEVRAACELPRALDPRLGAMGWTALPADLLLQVMRVLGGRAGAEARRWSLQALPRTLPGHRYSDSGTHYAARAPGSAGAVESLHMSPPPPLAAATGA